jgi:hypothetical protein
MLFPTSKIKNWRDLQDKVAILFREMGYDATTPFTVELAGRGNKEVDVYIRDPQASVNQIMLAECKLWESTVPQDTVHSFHTVMIGRWGEHRIYHQQGRIPERRTRSSAEHKHPPSHVGGVAAQVWTPMVPVQIRS